MKNQKKLIVIVTMIALLICVALMSCAMADEKIYTSPTFKLPSEKIMDWAETQPEGEAPAEGQPEQTPAEPEQVPDWEDPDYDPRDGESDEAPAEGTVTETPAEGTVTETPAEGTEGETPAETAGDEGEIVGEAKTPERSVTIRSSQGDVVTEGEIIYLTSKLKGFDGLDIAYQWQVDRGDGAGWVDVEGANRPKHMFVADRETITYSWRLIVTVMDGE